MVGSQCVQKASGENQVAELCPCVWLANRAVWSGMHVLLGAALTRSALTSISKTRQHISLAALAKQPVACTCAG